MCIFVLAMQMHKLTESDLGKGQNERFLQEDRVVEQKDLELLVDYSFHQDCKVMYYAVGSPPLDEVLCTPLMRSVKPVMSHSFRLGSFEDCKRMLCIP